MYTIVETPTFMRCAADVWNEAELMEFKLRLAGNPLSGDVITGTGGLFLLQLKEVFENGQS